jgi:deoxyadenosine/deoxycytidine kinase
MLVYSIEGAVGVGKSELVRIINEWRDADILRSEAVCVVDEPVMEWMELGDHTESPLNMLYRDPKRYAGVFQMYVFVDMWACLLDALREHERVYNRLPNILFVVRYEAFAAKEVFIPNLISSGAVDHGHLEMYDRMSRALRFQDVSPWHYVSGRDDLVFLYVHADVNDVLERVARRNRVEEQMTQQNTFMQLHNLYEEWLGMNTTWYSEDLGEEVPVFQVNNDALGALHHSFEQIVNTPRFHNALHLLVE